MDAVHGFVGIAALLLLFLESRGCFTPRRAPANHVLSQLVEVSEETALAVPGAAFGAAFGAQGAAASSIHWGLGFHRKTAKMSRAQAHSTTSGSINEHLYCLLLDFGT